MDDMVRTKTISLRTNGTTDVHDITPQVINAVNEGGLTDGIAVIICIGSTGAVTTLEFEPGLEKDIKDILQELIPEGRGYAHDDTWGDDNGHSHLRSALIGTSFTVPVTNGKLILGTWQQIVFIELDHRGRNRQLVIKMLGEFRQ
jgi:secondary thiamine-phosphate synthase enzyme